MSDVKHTSGPLVAEEYASPRGRWFIHREGERKMLNYPLSEGDAKLWAAAPELLRELDMQVRNCPVCKGDGIAVDVLDMLTKKPPHEKKSCSRCASSRAALAKAGQP